MRQLDWIILANTFGYYDGNRRHVIPEWIWDNLKNKHFGLPYNSIRGS